ncbi:MAG: type II toxin-antitoxin system prevent-host-death family antitoxin [Planctomycetales bacterium]|nr:type II toxin-antitoxin system prevent-host-death family antitoxin [Planctomycetales bacterium]
MYIANINETKAHLSQLINRVLAGDEVVIARANHPLIRMIPFEHDTRPRIGGQWQGKVEIGDQFEFTDEELADLFHILPGDGAQ